MDEFNNQSRNANSAGTTSRGGLGQLGVTPHDRSSRTTKKSVGKQVGTKSETWRDML